MGYRRSRLLLRSCNGRAARAHWHLAAPLRNGRAAVAFAEAQRLIYRSRARRCEFDEPAGHPHCLTHRQPPRPASRVHCASRWRLRVIPRARGVRRGSALREDRGRCTASRRWCSTGPSSRCGKERSVIVRMRDAQSHGEMPWRCVVTERELPGVGRIPVGPAKHRITRIAMKPSLRGIGILRRTSAVRSYSGVGPRAPILRAKSKEHRT